MAFCDAVRPQFITTLVTLAYVSLSNPQSQAAAISFIAKCVTEYGVCAVPLKKVLDSGWPSCPSPAGNIQVRLAVSPMVTTEFNKRW
jgi:hypothetical protein